MIPVSSLGNVRTRSHSTARSRFWSPATRIDAGELRLDTGGRELLSGTAASHERAEAGDLRGRVLGRRLAECLDIDLTPAIRQGVIERWEQLVAGAPAPYPETLGRPVDHAAEAVRLAGTGARRPAENPTAGHPGVGRSAPRSVAIPGGRDLRRVVRA
jgi:hypothetical protein